MSTQEQSQSRDRERLARLEGRIRQLQFVIAALATVLVIAGLAGFVRPDSDVHQARRFEILREDGSVAGVLGMSRIQTLSKEGVGEAFVPSLILHGADGEPRLRAQVEPSDRSALYMMDEQGNYRVALDFHRGQPGLSFASPPEQGGAELGLGLRFGSDPFVMLMGGNERPGLQLYANGGGASAEWFSGSEARASMAIDPEGQTRDDFAD